MPGARRFAKRARTASGRSCQRAAPSRPAKRMSPISARAAGRATSRVVWRANPCALIFSSLLTVIAVAREIDSPKKGGTPRLAGSRRLRPLFPAAELQQCHHLGAELDESHQHGRLDIQHLPEPAIER